MRIGTAEPNSTFLTQGQALATVLKARGISGPIEVLQSLSASIENARRIGAGDLDYGFMAANWTGLALRGEPPFTAPIDLRLVAPMNVGPMFFIAKRSASIATVADLRGKRVSVGPATSGVCQHAHSIFGALGLAFSDFSPVFLDFASGAEALASGGIDAQLQSPIPNQVMSALDAGTDLKVLPYAPGDLETVLAKNSVYRTATMRKGALRALDRDSLQPGVVNVLMTHAQQDRYEVAALVRAIIAGADDLERHNPLFTGIADLWAPLTSEGETALIFEDVPLHDGARDGYRAAGLLA
ncbi:MAG: transporter solute receptor, family [Frankiales bacterium]|nr:transporter solute receptor, family [Frankiales bacterium]